MPKLKIIIFAVLFFLIIIGFLLYSRFISTKGLIIKEYKIINGKITDLYHGLKIVHISDIHYGSTIYKQELETMVERINLLKPDIVFFTGDLFSENEINDEYIKEITEVLSKIEVKINKYAINGNHDYDYPKEFKNIMKNSGFINLSDTYDIIYNEKNEAIFIAGLSTNSYGNLKIQDKIKPTMEYLESDNEFIYNILLLHEADFLDKVDYEKFDLVLAGHSHNGQVRLPFIKNIYTPYGAKKYYSEYYKLNNTELYISSGLGTSVLKFRFFNKPSFNFYRITNK
ncbi:MAG: metallophosphoesterase [Bacilli bacterium]|nr:metallophosphoesterase [Bacilli bacterium]MDD4809433.1 metallophosphoesterase [Bacilli bacterium]